MMPFYELDVENVKDRSGYASYETSQIYHDKQECMEVARKVAKDIAWFLCCDGHLEDVYVVKVLYGRKFNKKGVVTGRPDVVYTVSSNEKEITDKIIRKYNRNELSIQEYTRLQEEQTR